MNLRDPSTKYKVVKIFFFESSHASFKSHFEYREMIQMTCTQTDVIGLLSLKNYFLELYRTMKLRDIQAIITKTIEFNRTKIFILRLNCVLGTLTSSVASKSCVLRKGRPDIDFVI